MIYSCVWSIYIWSYIVYASRSLFLDSAMSLWFHRCSLKLDWWGSEWRRSIRRERNQTRNQVQDWGWCPFFPSYLLILKEKESSFSLFVSKIATSLSGTSSSAWTLDFLITVTQNFRVTLEENEENEWERLGNDGKFHGNGLGWWIDMALISLYNFGKRGESLILTSFD